MKDVPAEAVDDEWSERLGRHGSLKVGNEGDVLLRAKVYYAVREYDHAAFISKDCQTELGRFLKLHSKFLSAGMKAASSSTRLFSGSNHLQYMWKETSFILGPFPFQMIRLAREATVFSTWR